MSTWRRMRCVERSIALFCEQTVDSELIVFNTDTEHPVKLGLGFPANVRVINQGADSATGKPYADIGAVRRDALWHATGEHYICWDDDDIFLPWNNRQCLDGITSSPNAWAWKPFSSMWSWGNRELEIAQNNMEASIIARVDKVREGGFDAHAGGAEHLQWIAAIQKSGRLNVSKESIPAYCFNWSDPSDIGGHKQSGTIGRPDNFEHHKKGCTDIHSRPLQRVDVTEMIQRHARFLQGCVCRTFSGHTIEPRLFERYVAPHL